MSIVHTMKIIEQEQIAQGVYRCVLVGDLVQAITNPGQFIQLQVPDSYLRRPISICDYDKARNQLTLIYKTFGPGTTAFSELQVGTEVSCMGPLGNGFNTDKLAQTQSAILVGGGVGVPPLFSLAKTLLANNPKQHIQVVLGFASHADVFYLDAFKALGIPTTLMTNDGSAGVKGSVLDAMKTTNFDFIYSCGPTGMLKAIETAYPEIPGQVSLEERMACGFGACMACVCKTKDEPNGYKRICLDGPVVDMGGIVYE